MADFDARTVETLRSRACSLIVLLTYAVARAYRYRVIGSSRLFGAARHAIIRGCYSGPIGIIPLSVCALIPAAGRGNRLAAERPKQYLALAGRPMLWHAVRSVCVPQVTDVFVVLAPDDTMYSSLDWTEFDGRLEPLYCGGASRRDSVYNGLVAAMAAIDAEDWILVHDAARPCLPESDIARLLQACAGDAVGGLLALPISDTVKRAELAHAQLDANVVRVAGTVDRESLWLAQTPQMFRAGLLAEALQNARGAITDEAGAIEEMGLKPRIVPGSRQNIKVTFPEDVAIADAILRSRPAQR